MTSDVMKHKIIRVWLLFKMIAFIPTLHCWNCGQVFKLILTRCLYSPTEMRWYAAYRMQSDKSESEPESSVSILLTMHFQRGVGTVHYRHRVTCPKWRNALETLSNEKYLVWTTNCILQSHSSEWDQYSELNPLFIWTLQEKIRHYSRKLMPRTLNF